MTSTSGFDVFQQFTPVLVVLLTVIAVGLVLQCAKSRKKGFQGEYCVNTFALGRLDPLVYRVFKDVYVPRPDGPSTTLIDHVVVSEGGIFVIETKNYSGWIFGSRRAAKWTRCFKGGLRYEFQNPLLENRLHVNALSVTLNLPAAVFHPVVYFAGFCTFKTWMPSNVIDSGLGGFIQSRQKHVLSAEQVKQAIGVLRELQTVDREAAEELHLEGLALSH